MELALLFLTILGLSSLPTLSSLTVAAYSSAQGWKAGLGVIVGVVLGDLLFLSIAIFGADQIARFQFGAKLLAAVGASYLLFVSIRLLRSGDNPDADDTTSSVALGRKNGLVAGFAVTLADQKAVLFYLSILPAFGGTSSQTPLLVAACVALGLLLGKSPYLIGGKLFQRLTHSHQIRNRLQRVIGVSLTALALFIVVRLILGE